MIDICEHDTFKDICAVCHRITVITNLTDENTRLTADVERLRAELRTAADMNAVYEGRLQEKEAEVERLTIALREDRRARVLASERRVDELNAENKRLRAALEKIEGQPPDTAGNWEMRKIARAALKDPRT